MVVNGLFLFNGANEALGGLEGRDVVCRDGNGSFAGDIAGGLLGAVLDDKATETTEVHRITCYQGTFYHVGEFFNNCQYLRLLQTGGFGYFVYNLCLSHSFYSFYSLVFTTENQRKIRLYFLQIKILAVKNCQIHLWHGD
jgi:hypothetical protein